MSQDANDPEYPIIFPPSRGKLFLLFLGCLAFVLLFLYQIKEGSFKSELQHFMAYVGVIFFGFGGFVGIWHLFNPSVWLEIYEDGFRTGRRATTFVPWSEVVSLEIYRLDLRNGARQKFIRVDVRDMDRFGKNKSWFTRALKALSRQWDVDCFLINTRILEGSFDEILGAMTSAFENSRKLKNQS